MNHSSIRLIYSLMTNYQFTSFLVRFSMSLVIIASRDINWVCLLISLRKGTGVSGCLELKSQCLI